MKNLAAALVFTTFTLQAENAAPGTSASAGTVASEAKVTIVHSATDTAFKAEGHPLLFNNDAGTKATFKIISGTADPNGAKIDVVQDGQAPGNEDDPQHNFFFNNGEKGGRITADLHTAIDMMNVATYSWHRNLRAPQIYKLYAAGEGDPAFNPEPAASVDPVTVGWKLIASVDTRDKGPGQHVASIAMRDGKPLGKFRYLLFDIEANAEPNSQGNTFFSEIDIVDANGPALTHFERKVEKFDSKDGKFHYILDSTESPDLAEWAKINLLPVMEGWYPKIIKMLPVDGYTPPDTINFTMKLATTLPAHVNGVPAFASGNNVTLNAKFMRDQANGEAVGCAVHEIVHVVQFGGHGDRFKGNRPPTWVTEGVADYIRWFLYEPQSKGAEITTRNVGRAKYDDSYRTTGNFFDWVIKTHEKDLMRKLNQATHNGYTEQLWKDWTGKTAEELNDEWKAANKKRLGVE